VDDCEVVSRRLSDLLDKKDFIKDASYILEVSSPGLGRQLKKDKDFDRNMGKEVEIRLYKSFQGRKEYKGVLQAYSKDTVTIADDKEGLTLNRADIALIRLAFDF